MAERLQAIQRRMKSIESTEKIASAMQLVAAAKLKQSTNRFNYTREHIAEMIDRFEAYMATQDLDTLDPEDVDTREIAPSLTIVITGSKGMCGSYNSSIIKEMEDVRAMTFFLPLGAKGHEHIVARELPLLEIENKSLYLTPPDESTYPEIRELAKELTDKQVKREIADIRLLSAKYLNSMAYSVENKLAQEAYIIEKTPHIVPYLEEVLALKIYGAIAEAALNEYGARRLAMKNASDNADEMLTDLSMKYHRARQAQITDELIEIISGTESQRSIEEANKKARKKKYE